MPDQRFFGSNRFMTLSQLASASGAELFAQTANPKAKIHGAASLHQATQVDVAVVRSTKDSATFRTSRAGACFVRPTQAREAPSAMALLLTPTPCKAFALAVRALYPPPAPIAGAAEGAIIEATAQVGDGSEIQSGAVVRAGARVGQRCLIGANAVIGPNVEIGDDTRVGAGAHVSHCLIGRRVSILPGACIGQEGFDFARVGGRCVRVPQIGRVIIGDDVEVGANTTIDRGGFSDTVVGDGSVIDNLVHIGHGVEIGPGCVIIAQVGIAGDVKVEPSVVLAGQVGIAAGLTIGAGARIGGKSAVLRNVPAAAEYFGIPAVPKREFARRALALKRLSAAARSPTNTNADPASDSEPRDAFAAGSPGR